MNKINERLLMRQTRATIIVVLFCWLRCLPVLATSNPTITPATGTYLSPSTLVTFTGDPSSTFYYTLDGSVPNTTTSPVYTGSFGLTGSTQIRALAVAGGSPSGVTTNWQLFDPTSINLLSSPQTNYELTANNLVFWFRADFGTTSSANNVSQWGDVSTTTLNGTGSTAVPLIATSSSTQPTFVPGAVDGLPAVNFTPGSSGQFLTIAQPYVPNPSAPPSYEAASFSSGVSVFAVVLPGSAASGTQIVSLGTGSTANAIGLSVNSSSQPTFYVNNSSGTSSSVSSSTAFSTTQFQLLEATQSGIIANLYTNGSLVSTNSSMNALPGGSVYPTSNCIGGLTTGSTTTGLFQGKIAEILVFNTAVSTSVRAAVESLLMQKYQITTQLPMAPIISIQSPTGGSVSLNAPTQVSISAQPNTTVYYSTSGSVSTSSPVYTGPININYSLTLNTIAVRGSAQSTTSSSSYILNSAQWPAPASGGPTLQINPTAPTIAIP